MTTWTDFTAESPELAELGKERIERHGLVLLGTIRKDGTPRISPIEASFFDDELTLGGMWRSKKMLDLLRDPRCLVHSIITSKDGNEGEFKLRGTAVSIDEPAGRTRYADAVFAATGWRPEEPFHLFKIDVQQAAFIVFRDDKMHRKVWPGSGEWIVSDA